MAGSAVTNIPRAHGGLTRASSADPSDTCSSSPAIRPRRELPLPLRSQMPSALLPINRRRCRRFRRPRFHTRMPGRSSIIWAAPSLPVKGKVHLKQDYAYHTIWDVIGKVQGSELPDEWVVAGNHRDAWVYGAADPNSGTTAMLESVAGVGELLHSGWRPKRTLIFASWDAEEEGLIGSTEWGEQNAAALARAVAYVNVDVAVSGPRFGASSVPSLKQFLRDITKAVPSPQGGT